MNGETSDQDSCGCASENTSLMSTQVEPGTTDPDVGSSPQTTDQVIQMVIVNPRGCLLLLMLVCSASGQS